MKVTLSPTRTVTIRFRTERAPEERLFVAVKQTPQGWEPLVGVKPFRSWTRCVIEGDGFAKMGFSRCSEVDDVSVGEGNKHALERALRETTLGKEDRRAIWKEFLLVGVRSGWFADKPIWLPDASPHPRRDAYERERKEKMHVRPEAEN